MISWSQICGNHSKIPSFGISERNLPNLVDMSQCDYVGASWMSATLHRRRRLAKAIQIAGKARAPYLRSNFLSRNRRVGFMVRLHTTFEVHCFVSLVRSGNSISIRPTCLFQIPMHPSPHCRSEHSMNKQKQNIPLIHSTPLTDFPPPPDHIHIIIVRRPRGEWSHFELIRS